MWRIRFVSVVASLVAAGPILAQSGSVTGTVTSAESGAPIVGAQVRLLGTSSGAITGDDGRYSMRAAPGTYTVRVSRIGFSPDSAVGVAVAADAPTTVDFQLRPAAVRLQAVATIGYGTREARDLTGAVETVSSEEFNTGRIVSPQELLQGKVAGVQVINSGEPGGGTTIRIRGGTSINASNEPLFVVDGIPLPVGGGLSAGRNPLNFLNPDDIESISVLKDASATAIYGSRGANGVVMVTTKSGRAQGPQFTYSSTVSTSRIVDQPDMLSAAEFRAAVGEWAPGRVQYLGTASTNWRDAVLQSATGQEHSVAVSGGRDDMNYRLSVGYLDQEGVVRGSALERVSAALNYNHRLFEDKLNVRAFLRGARTDDLFTPGGGLGAATIYDPTQPIRTSTGFFEQTQFQLAPNNPLAELAAGVEDGVTYRSVLNLEGEYTLPFVEGLRATARVGYDLATSERRTFYPSTLWGQAKSSTPGYVSRSNPREATALLETFGTYSRQLAGLDSEIEATAGYSYEKLDVDEPFVEARGLSSDLLGPSGIPTAAEYNQRLNEREGILASFFGRLNYTLRDRYLATVSVRRDGSSRFGPANQWATFPSVALAWRASEEPFLRNVGWLSDLKLRASWGVNGNQAIGDYLWAATYRYSDPFASQQFGNEFVTTIRPTAVDPDIKWEETTSYNIGFDYGILNNRFFGSVEYYHKDTDDLIFRVPVAAGTYVSNFVTTNIGSVRNQGVEVSLSALVFAAPPQDGFNWTATFNASTNRNRLLSINPFGGGAEQILTGSISGGVGNTIQVLQPGQPVNAFHVYRHKRDASGKPVYSDDMMDMYVDVNKDGIINFDDRVPVESPAPKWVLGHTSQMGWRNLDLSFTMRAHLGNYVYNNLSSFQGYYARLNEAAGPVNLHRSVLETGFETPQFFSDYYLEDASFLRMDNLTLGWTIPQIRTLQRVRLFGTVQNVFTLTGYSGVDPEVYCPSCNRFGIDDNIYPRSRTYTVGTSFGF